MADTLIDVSAVFMDFDAASDNDTLYVEVFTSDPGLLSASLDAGRLRLGYQADANGQALVRVRAEDSSGGAALQTFTVTVHPVNDAPFVNAPLEDLEVPQDASPLVVSLSDLFRDRDLWTNEDRLTVRIRGNDRAGLVSASLNGTDLTLTVQPHEIGEATITLEAEDLAGAAAQSDFLVLVRPSHTASAVHKSFEIHLGEDQDTIPAVDLSALSAAFDEILRDGASVRIFNDHPRLLQATLAGTTLRLQPLAEQHGQAQVIAQAVGAAGASATATWNITVGAVNDPPQVIAGEPAFVIAEDTRSWIAGLRVDDVDLDVDGEAIQVSLSAQHGALTVIPAVLESADGNGTSNLVLKGNLASLNAVLTTLSYIGSQDYHGPDTITVTADDLGLSGQGTTTVSQAGISLDIQAVNDAPLLQAASSSLGNASEDAAISIVVSDIAEDGITDADTDVAAGGVALTGVTGQGNWEFSLDGGQQWNPVPIVTETRAVLLDAAARLRYTPDGRNGESATIAYRAWDQTSGTSGDVSVDTSRINHGGTTAFSANLGEATLSVISVNDAPVLIEGVAAVLTGIAEDDLDNPGDLVSAITASAGGAWSTDVDVAAIKGIAITAVASGNGTWEYRLDEAAGWNVLGSLSATQSLLLRSSDRLRFVPDGRNGDLVSLTLRGWDQTSGAAGTRVDTSNNGENSAFSLEVGTADLTVTPVNDPPEKMELDGTSVPEELAGGLIGTILVTDVDVGDQFEFVLSDQRFEVVDAVVEGRHEKHLKLKDAHKLDFESEEFVDLRIKATDRGLASLEQPFPIGVTPVNETPQIALDNSQVFEKTSGLAVGRLTVVDPEDDPQTLVLLDDRFELRNDKLALKSGKYLERATAVTVELQVRATDANDPNISATMTLSLDVMANSTPGRNRRNPYDVNNDSAVSALDVLNVINYINGGFPIQVLILYPDGDGRYYFRDVTGDRFVTAADVLAVINAINRGTSSGEGEFDRSLAPALPSGSSRPTTLPSWPLSEVSGHDSPAHGTRLSRRNQDSTEKYGARGRSVLDTATSGQDEPAPCVRRRQLTRSSHPSSDRMEIRPDMDDLLADLAEDVAAAFLNEKAEDVAVREWN